MRAHLAAALAAAILPPLLAFGAVQAFPAGCALRGDPGIYRWSCLLPALVTVAAPVVAAILLGCAWLFAGLRDLPRKAPAPFVLGTGAAVHLVMAATYAAGLDPAYRFRFIGEMLWIPQPFLSGALPAAVYVLALRAARGRSAAPPK